MATYGLATQLRTPPQDGTPFAAKPMGRPHDFGAYSVSKRTTPAMRDEQKRPGAPGSGIPTWSSRQSQGPDRERGGNREDGDAQRREGQSHRSPSLATADVPRRSLHARSKSSSRADPARHESNEWAPSRPPRPHSPSIHPLPVPPLPVGVLGSRGATPMQKSKSQHQYHSSTSSSFSPPNANLDFDFSPTKPLDLGIQIDTQKQSTFRATPSPASPSSPDPDEGYLAQVGVAERVSRGGSWPESVRKASIATIVQTPHPQASLPTVPRQDDTTVAPASHLRPSRPPSSDGSTRPIGQGLRSSYAGSISAPVSFRRSSSVYIPNRSAAPPPTVGHGIGPARVEPTLLTLAQRTSHIATVPGYGWRLHLLEKLEAVVGSYLTISEAEDILAIGNGAEAKPSRSATRLQSRRSQIGMPMPSNKAKPPPKSPGVEKSGFFVKIKRNLFNEPAPQPKVQVQAPASKVVFGQPLSVVADYGFVTSMIAGQRHDLPGVVFSTVEEIYRRGQGSKIPGLLHLNGEPSRIAKLTAIYDSPPDYGEHHDLSIESIHNVTSLLKKYLGDLPESVLDRRLWRLFLWACVDSTAPVKQRIACAQIILRLLPAPNFSLLVYLIAFLSQMPLFPENKLPLDSVASIFGPLTMASRSGSSAAAKLNRLMSGSLVITGPTDNHVDAGVTSKKAQDALLWLLTHWSSIADGLLEPDFDIDVDAVLDKRPVSAVIEQKAPDFAAPTMSQSHTSPASPNQRSSTNLSPAQTQGDLRSPALDSQLASGRSPPRPGSVLHNNAHLSPASILHRAAPSPTNTLEIQAQARARSRASSSASHATTSSPRPMNMAPSPSQTWVTVSSSHPASTTAPSEPASKSPNSFLPPPLDHSKPKSDAGATVTTEESSANPDTSSSRSSDSTIETSVSSRGDAKTHAPLYHNSGKLKGATDGLPRAIPEDQFGPLGPVGSSVLDDLLANGDFARRSDPAASLFSFPTPPSEYGSSFSPDLSADGPHGAPRSETILARSKGEQLREARAAQEAQRKEIQILWKQLTENELARAAEKSEIDSLQQEIGGLRAKANSNGDANREELDGLRKEVRELKERLDQRTKDEASAATMEARWKDAQRALKEAHEELELVKEESAAEAREAKTQISSLKSQVEAIRSVLGGGLKI